MKYTDAASTSVLKKTKTKNNRLCHDLKSLLIIRMYGIGKSAYKIVH